MVVNMDVEIASPATVDRNIFLIYSFKHTHTHLFDRYFMAKTWLFMEKIGMDPARLRFRQHLKTEMAHYAADCWDLEIKSSYG